MQKFRRTDNKFNINSTTYSEQIGGWYFYANFQESEEYHMEKSTMSVQELSSRMGISLPKAYALVKEPGFPVIRIGTRILIPVEGFHRWLKEKSEGDGTDEKKS